MTPTEALAPLIAIADAYDASNLDEVRPEWNYEKPGTVELFTGRGGRQLLTLQDCLDAREAVAQNPRQTYDQVLEPCPFCGSSSVDPEGWLSTDSKGPACDDCGASAQSVEQWNKRPKRNPTPCSISGPSMTFSEWFNAGPAIAKEAGIAVEITVVTALGNTMTLTSADFAERAALSTPQEQKP